MGLAERQRQECCDRHAGEQCPPDAQPECLHPRRACGRAAREPVQQPLRPQQVDRRAGPEGQHRERAAQGVARERRRGQRRVKQSAGHKGYVVLGFCDDMASVYAVTDLILCRAGASSMTELAHAGLPSILVPYPYAADDHQTKNAEVFAAAGAAKMVQQADLDASGLAAMVDAIIGHGEVVMKMKSAARSLDVPDAAARVCSAMEATLK